MMYLFVRSEQNKIKMHVNASPYDGMALPVNAVNVNDQYHKPFDEEAAEEEELIHQPHFLVD